MSGVNTSKQLALAIHDDSVSMYLSFDSESFYCPTDENENDDDSKGNTTLEPGKDEDLANYSNELTKVLEPLHLRKRAPLMEMLLVSNADFKSSTPSKSDMYFDKHKIDNLASSEENRNAFNDIPENINKHFEKSPKTDKLSEVNIQNEMSSTDNDSLPSFSSTTILKIQNENDFNSARMKKPNSKIEKSVGTEKSISNNAAKKKVKMQTSVRRSLCEPNYNGQRSFPCSYLDNQSSGNGTDCEWSAFDNYAQGRYLDTITEGTGVDENIMTDGSIIDYERKSNQKTIKKSEMNARKSFVPNITNEPKSHKKTYVFKTTRNGLQQIAPRKSYVATSNKSKRRSVSIAHNLGSPSRPKLSRVSNVQPHKYIQNSRNSGGFVERPSSSNKSTSIGRKTISSTKTETTYPCPDCDSIFNVKSLFDAHRDMHKRKAASIELPRNGSTNNSTSNHQCKYCDKVFALERTLHIHLMEYCPKIPASERRKLDFKEMDHVVKAATPHFNLGQPTMNTKYNKDTLINLPIQKLQNGQIELAKKRHKNESAKKHLTYSSTNENSSKEPLQMAPPSMVKVKKKIAHAGVNRTPNKKIHCLSCEQTFKNVIEYTNHMMTAHEGS